jgi:hypothetical protein
MRPATTMFAQALRHPHPADAAERELRSLRRQRVAAAAFIACYVVGWAWLVGLTDPAGWDALLAVGFGVLFALVLLVERVATARSLRASASQQTMEAPNLPESAAAPADSAAPSVSND